MSGSPSENYLGSPPAAEAVVIRLSHRKLPLTHREKEAIDPRSKPELSRRVKILRPRLQWNPLLSVGAEKHLDLYNMRIAAGVDKQTTPSLALIRQTHARSDKLSYRKTIR